MMLDNITGERMMRKKKGREGEITREKTKFKHASDFSQTSVRMRRSFCLDRVGFLITFRYLQV